VQWLYGLGEESRSLFSLFLDRRRGRPHDIVENGKPIRELVG
jgi:hypothetical protein